MADRESRPQAIDTMDLLVRDSDPRRPFAIGDLVRLRRGSYVPTEAWVALDDPARFRLALAAHSWANPGAVYCGETALFLRGVPVVKAPPTIDVATSSTTRLGVGASTFQVQGASALTERARSLAPPRVRRHHHVSLEGEPVGEHLAVPLATALIEAMIHAKFARALTVADGVLRLNPGTPLLDRAPVLASLQALPFDTHRRRAAAIAALARSGAESPGESVSRALMLLFGFPEPELQRQYSDALGLIGRTDFAWPTGPGAPKTASGKERVGEMDGWGKYFNAEMTDGQDPVMVIKREKKRENRLLALGHPVIRWTWSELEKPARLRAMLIASGLRPCRSSAFAVKCA